MSDSVADERKEMILAAALQLVAVQGAGAWPLSALAHMTGLSRPAIYQYFASREHVLGELLVNEIADLSNEVDRVVAQHLDPREQIRVWVHYAFAHVASEKHRVMCRISVEHLPSELRGELRALHTYFLTALVDPLSSLGVSHPVSHAHIIFAALDASAQRVAGGSDCAGEAGVLERFVFAGIEHALQPQVAESG